jgi:hypothetical protein
VDKNLAYEAGTSTQHLANPDVVASAYTNNVPGSGSTQLYGLDAYNSWLVLQDPPNDGTVRRVARLNFAIPAKSVSFDITHEGNAYAAFQPHPGGRATLYRVDLNDQLEPLQPAAADPVIGSGIEVLALAAAGPARAPSPDPPPTVRVSAKRKVSRASLRKQGLAVGARCSEACGVEAVLTYRGAPLGSATAQLGSAGVARIVVRLGRGAARALAGRGRRKLVLRVTATDGTGRTATARRGVVAR